MMGDDSRELLREVMLAGQCSHPVRLRGNLVNLETGEIVNRQLKVACKDRRENICPACSRRYGGDAWIIAATGLGGGKGVPEEVGTAPRAFVTVTAPSFGRVHTIRRNGRCHNSRGEAHFCVHDVSSSCDDRHTDSDQVLGRPLCGDCFDYRGEVLWNAHSSKVWESMIQGVRREVTHRLNLSRREFRAHAAIEYFKVAELQRRGVVHFHGLIRLDVDDELSSASDLCAGLGDFETAIRRAISLARVESALGMFQLGKVKDVQLLGTSDQDKRRLSTYLAKYVTKTAGDGIELARRFESVDDISLMVKDPHLRQVAMTAWDMSTEPKLMSLNLRRCANSLGYRGQPITKSLHYSTTFRALRQARTEFMSGHREGEPLEGTFSYDGRGYDNPRSPELAEVLNALDRELRTAANVGSVTPAK